MRISPSFVVGSIALLAAVWTPCSSSAEAPAPPPPANDPKANFHETGRVGVIGAITEDGWKGGLVFEHEYFEAQLLGHGDYTNKHNHDIRLTYKLGGRAPLGTLNYLAFGMEFGHHPGGREDGVSLSHDYFLGPYISLQRYFAATPVMLNLWVNPVQYDHEIDVEDGQAHVNVNWHIFQTGGFGIAYIF